MKNMIRIIFTILFLMMSLFCYGCAYNQKNGTIIGQDKPIVIKNFDGYAGNGRLIQQTFTKVPRRVLAVSEAVIDNLIFLGLQDKIVAINAHYSKSYAPYDAEYAKFTRLTKGNNYPSKEAVLGLQPDCIIGWGSLFGEGALGSVEYWQQKGIYTYVMTNTVPIRASGERKVEYFVNDLQQLAKIFRIEDKAQPKIMALKKRIDTLKRNSEAIAEERKPRVVTVQSIYGNEYYGRTATDMTADMIKLAGGICLDDLDGGRKNVEYLVKLNPDMLLVVDTETTPVNSKIKALREHKVLKKLKAVRDNKIFIVKHRAFYCGSLRSVETIAAMQRYIKESF